MISRRWRRITLASLAVTALFAGAALHVLRPRHLRGEGGAAPDAALVERLRQAVASLPAPRPVGSEALARAEEEVAVRFRAAGYTVEKQPVEHGGVKSHNVIAQRRAGMNEHVMPFGKLWVVGAHLDTVENSPGADDNGSGVAVMLEVAEKLARTPAADFVMFIAFADEERGLRGSHGWVRGLQPHQRSRIGGAFVLDTIGFRSGGPGSQRYPQPLGLLGPDTGDFTGAITLREHQALLDLFVAARGRAAPALPLLTLAAPRQLAELVPDLWRSDHAPMWRADIPALFLTDTANFRNPNYHRPHDLPETLHYETMAGLVEVLVEAIRTASAPPG